MLVEIFFCGKKIVVIKVVLMDSKMKMVKEKFYQRGSNVYRWYLVCIESSVLKGKYS